jgi:hypothetical protein
MERRGDDPEFFPVIENGLYKQPEHNNNNNNNNNIRTIITTIKIINNACIDE